MTLREIHVANGSGGYTNSGNGWCFMYGTGTVTVKDAAGNVTKLTNLPCWVPPGFNITTGTSTDILVGLYSDKEGAEGIQEFAGFLSRPGGSVAAAFAILNGGPSVALSGLTVGQDVFSDSEGLVVGSGGANTPKGFIAQGGSETLSETISSLTVV